MLTWHQPISREIFQSKYMINGESCPEQVLEEVAECIGANEARGHNIPNWQARFAQMMLDGELLPAGRILANARVARNTVRNFNNCFTIELDDSMEGIFEALREDAIISKNGGGVGFDASPLRPKDAPISKGGTSSGVISFLRIFNESAKSIHTGGSRRSAHIALLDISHPDIEEFLTIKQGDDNKELTQFNISVKVTDAFMQAVEDNSPWDLVHGGRVYKTVMARQLYDLLIKNAFYANEPGLFFVDTVNRFNNVPWAYHINSCNPCFSGDTLVATGNGLEPIASLVGKPTQIYDGNQWVEVDTFKKMGENQALHRVTMGSGLYYDCTANHNWILADGTRKQTCELALGDELQHVESDEVFTKFGIKKDRAPYLKGFLLAEGCVTKHNRPILYLYTPKAMCFNRIAEELSGLLFESYNNRSTEEIDLTVSPSNEERASVTGLSGRAKEEDLASWSSRYKEKLPDEVFSWDQDSICGLIAGLFDGDGTLATSTNGSSLQFNSIYKDLCIDVIRLLGLLGVRSSLNFAYAARNKVIKGVEYACQEVWRVVIPAEDSMSLAAICPFQRLKVEFPTTYHSKLRRHHRVMSVEAISGFHDVYCCEVETTHSFLLSGRNMTSNCGEQSLGPYQACCLAALNLAKFVHVPKYGEPWDFRMTALKQAVVDGVRFLDNVLDATEYPLPRNLEMAQQFRRIGLGFTGFGDMLALLGMRYDSREAQEFTRKLAKEFRDSAYQASVALAREKGAFADLYITNKRGDRILDDEKIEKLLATPFIKTLPESIREGIRKYGLRNVALLTVAPTGTISFSLGQNCSSGIEPIFSLEYDRTIRNSSQTDDTRTETVYDYGWLQYLKWNREVNGVSDADSHAQMPEAFKATAGAISPLAHVEMQAIWQEFIDSAISKTINLPPEGFAQEDYSELLQLAHKSGLKGFTTFNPNGKLKGILVDKSAAVKKDELPPIEVHHAPRRPDELPCDIHTMTYQGERYVVLVGMYGEQVYEAFVTIMTEDLQDQLNSFKTGYIVKHAKGKYSLSVDVEGEKKAVIKSLGKTFNPAYETVARMISMSLRHGVPLKFVIDQLSKGKDIQGFERILARVIKKYIKDGEVATMKCECGTPMEYREGCLTCPTCGASKCG